METCLNAAEAAQTIPDFERWDAAFHDGIAEAHPEQECGSNWSQLGESAAGCRVGATQAAQHDGTVYPHDRGLIVECVHGAAPG